jgi:D-alanine-D-alanine ligase-like ATP-grasp enzyme
MIETAKQAHQTLPMFDIIGWDMAIDEEKNCVIIEFNPDPDLRIEQLIYQGTLLLDKQERIIKDAYSRKI